MSSIASTNLATTATAVPQLPPTNAAFRLPQWIRAESYELHFTPPSAFTPLSPLPPPAIVAAQQQVQGSSPGNGLPISERLTAEALHHQQQQQQRSTFAAVAHISCRLDLSAIRKEEEEASTLSSSSPLFHHGGDILNAQRLVLHALGIKLQSVTLFYTTNTNTAAVNSKNSDAAVAEGEEKNTSGYSPSQSIIADHASIQQLFAAGGSTTVPTGASSSGSSHFHSHLTTYLSAPSTWVSHELDLGDVTTFDASETVSLNLGRTFGELAESRAAILHPGSRATTGTTQQRPPAGEATNGRDAEEDVTDYRNNGGYFVLRIAYTGVVHDSNVNTKLPTSTHGLYRCNGDQDEQFMLTHLEPTNARRLYPCFDEPSFKATYRVTVDYDAAYQVVSGTNVEHEAILWTEGFEEPTILTTAASVTLGASTTTTGVPSSLAATSPASLLTNLGAGLDPLSMSQQHQLMSSAANAAALQRSPNLSLRRLSSGAAMLSGNANIPPSMSATTSGGGDATGAGIGETSPSTAPVLQQIRRTVFKPTPILSAYLVSFAIGKFHMLQQHTKRRGLLCRVLFPSTDHLNEGWYALDLLTKAVDFYEQFFQYDLPLDKLDIVGVTEFGVLGMENWGMMSFMKEYLLVNETTPIERRQRIARLIGHEVAHQWYGNLISVDWWDQLWLKEGFCRYLEFFFVNHVFPQWSMWSEFLTLVLDEVLVLDCRPDRTHPVESCNATPRMIFDSFDVISYGKGASLLRMLAATLGEDRLETAIQALVRRFLYGAFTKADFLRCLEEAVDGDREKVELCQLIVDWVTVSGHPLVLVHRDDDHHSHHQHHPQGAAAGAPRGTVAVNLESVLTSQSDTFTNTSEETPREYDLPVPTTDPATTGVAQRLSMMSSTPLNANPLQQTTGEPDSPVPLGETQPAAAAGAIERVLDGDAVEYRQNSSTLSPRHYGNTAAGGHHRKRHLLCVSQYLMPDLNTGILPYYLKQKQRNIRHSLGLGSLLGAPPSPQDESNANNAAGGGVQNLSPRSGRPGHHGGPPTATFGDVSIDDVTLEEEANDGKLRMTTTTTTTSSPGGVGGVAPSTGVLSPPYTSRHLRTQSEFSDNGFVPHAHNNSNHNTGSGGGGAGGQQQRRGISATPRKREFVWSPSEVFKPSQFVIPLTVLDLVHGQSSVRRNVVLDQTQCVLELEGNRGGAQEALTYINYCAAAVARCDYDVSSWHRVFEYSPFLTVQDRLAITMSLFRLRTLHIGKIFADEPEDRCTLLLEWLVQLSRQKSIQSTLWRYLTEQLEVLLYLLRDHPCWGVFADFIASLYHHAIQVGLVNFHTIEKPVDFQANNSLSAQTTMRILQNLAVCKSLDLLPEAEQLVDWALAQVLSHSWSNLASGDAFEDVGTQQQQHSNTTSNTGTPTNAARNNNVGNQPQQQQQQSSQQQHLLGGSFSANPTSVLGRTPSVGESASAHPNGTPAGSPGPANVGAGTLLDSPSSPSLHGIANNGNAATSFRNPTAITRTFDVRNDADVTKVTIAMQMVTEVGDVQRWWKLASVLAVALNKDIHDFVTNTFIAQHNLLMISVDASELEQSSAVRNRWVNILAAPVLAMEDPNTFAFSMAVLQCFSGMSAPVAKAILRNTKLITALLEDYCECHPNGNKPAPGSGSNAQSHYIHNDAQSVLSTGLRDGLLHYASGYCSNLNIMALFRASLLGVDATTSPAVPAAPTDSFAGTESALIAAAMHSKSIPISRRTMSGDASTDALMFARSNLLGSVGATQWPSRVSASQAKSMERLELNCAWVDYVADHYSAFLKAKRKEGAWAGNATAAGNGRFGDSDPPTGSLNVHTGGVSI